MPTTQYTAATNFSKVSKDIAYMTGELKKQGYTVESVSKSYSKLSNSIRQTTAFMQVGAGKTVQQTMSTSASGVKTLNDQVLMLDNNFKKVNARAKLFGITWGAAFRLITVQIGHMALAQFMQNMRSAIREAAQLEQALGEIKTIDLTSATPSDWYGAGERLSQKYGIEIADQLEAAYESLSNQVITTVQDFRLFGEVVNQFAITARTTSADSVDILSGAINAFSLEVEQANSIAAQYFRTIDLGRVRGPELTGIGDVNALAAQLGLAVEEVNAVISFATRRGIPANKVLTQLRGILVKLIKPTEDMVKFYRHLGVETGEAALATRSFAELMQDMQEYTGGSSYEMGKLINRVRGLSLAVALGGGNLEEYKQDLNAIINAEEDYAAAEEIMLGNTGKRWEKALNEMDLKWKQFGKGFLTVLDEYVGFDRLVGMFERSLALLFIAPKLLTEKGRKNAMEAFIPWVKDERLRIEQLEEYHQKYLQIQAKELEKQIRQTTKAYREENKILADRAATLTKQIDSYRDALGDQLEIIESQYDAQIDTLTDRFNKVEDKYRDHLKNIVDLQKSITDFERSKEAGLFKLSLKGVDDYQRANLISSELENTLQQLRRTSDLDQAKYLSKYSQQLFQDLVNTQDDFMDHTGTYTRMMDIIIEKHRELKNLETERSIEEKSRVDALEEKLKLLKEEKKLTISSINDLLDAKTAEEIKEASQKAQETAPENLKVLIRNIEKTTLEHLNVLDQLEANRNKMAEDIQSLKDTFRENVEKQTKVFERLKNIMEINLDLLVATYAGNFSEIKRLKIEKQVLDTPESYKQEHRQLLRAWDGGKGWSKGENARTLIRAFTKYQLARDEPLTFQQGPKGSWQHKFARALNLLANRTDKTKSEVFVNIVGKDITEEVLAQKLNRAIRLGLVNPNRMY